MNEFENTQSNKMTIGNWIVTYIISAIPIVGFIMLFVWGFGNNTNQNKANWSKAMLIFIGIIFIISMILVFVVGTSIIYLIGQIFGDSFGNEMLNNPNDFDLYLDSLNNTDWDFEIDSEDTLQIEDNDLDL